MRLMEELTAKAGCSSPANLNQPEYQSDIGKVLKEVSPEAYGLDEWVDAAELIAGLKSTFESQEQARDYLLEYISCVTKSVSCLSEEKTIAAAAEIVRNVKGRSCQVICGKKTGQLAVIVFPGDESFLCDDLGEHFTVATCSGDITGEELERHIKQTFHMRELFKEAITDTDRGKETLNG